MTFRNSVQVPMAPTNLVGVAVKATNPDRGHMHVGLIYQNTDDDFAFLHLAFHHQLINEPPPNINAYLWADCAWLATARSNAEYLADYIESCANNTEIDYGFDAPDDAFDADGRYDWTDPSKGLTCATFVAAVIKGAGFPIVDLTQWPSRSGDQTWRNSVMRLLQHHAPHRASQIAGHSAAFRLRPSEVAIAAAARRNPTSFELAARAGGCLEIAMGNVEREHRKNSGP